MESYYELKKMLCRELDEIVNKSKGELSAGSLDAIDKLTHSIKSLLAIMEMSEGEYSYARGGRSRYAYEGGGGGGGGNSGRYYDDWSSDGGYSGRRYFEDGYSGRRSRDEGKSRMIQEFEKLMGNAATQEEREVVQSALNRLKNM